MSLAGRDLPPPPLGLTVTVAVAISTIGNSAWLIGADCMIVNEAGYVIVNELALTRRAVERTRIPAGLADLIHRALAARPVQGILVSPRLEVHRERCTAFSAKGILPNAKKESTVTPQALMGGTRSSVMGKIIAVAAGQDKNSWLFDPQTSAACPGTSPDVRLSLKIRILHMGVFWWTNPAAALAPASCSRSALSCSTTAAQTLAWCVIVFASAGASAAYLTVSEIFLVEVRAQAIAVCFAIAQCFGAIGPGAIRPSPRRWDRPIPAVCR